MFVVRACTRACMYVCAYICTPIFLFPCIAASAGLSSPPFPPESFDRVLVDAPCSALGQRPQIKCSMSGKELRSFPAYQRQIFEKVRVLYLIGYPTFLLLSR